MSSDLAVSVRNLGKCYTIRHDDERSLKERIQLWARDPLRPRGREQFWALRGMDLEVCEGEIVGIIGRNGAGKSTLLKILSRITRPTEGVADLYGRVGSLLEVGTGFHRELTGRENIYLNGSILGMSRRNITQRFDEIVAFSGVERFLDTPVKRYSSGMFVRLAFAVAAHLEPDILIVDEVLAVGDAEFQRKCLGKMRDVAREGRTVLFVSHNIATIESLCERCVWIDGGSVKIDGSTREVLEQYLGEVVNPNPEVDLTDHPGRVEHDEVLLRRARLFNGRGELSATVRVGEALRVQLLVHPRGTLGNPLVGIGVSNAAGQRVFTVHTRFSTSELPTIDEPTWIECEMPDLRLLPGNYRMRIAIGVHGKDLDAIENAAAFEVLPGDYFHSGAMPSSAQGMVAQESRWQVLGGELAEVS